MSAANELEEWIKNYEPSYKEKILEELRKQSPLNLGELSLRCYQNIGVYEKDFNEYVDIAISGIKLEEEGKTKKYIVVIKEDGTEEEFKNIQDIPDKYFDCEFETRIALC